MATAFDVDQLAHHASYPPIASRWRRAYKLVEAASVLRTAVEADGSLRSSRSSFSTLVRAFGPAQPENPFKREPVVTFGVTFVFSLLDFYECNQIFMQNFWRNKVPPG
jgi:hypothetical protein